MVNNSFIIYITGWKNKYLITPLWSIGWNIKYLITPLLSILQAEKQNVLGELSSKFNRIGSSGRNHLIKWERIPSRFYRNALLSSIKHLNIRISPSSGWKFQFINWNCSINLICTKDDFEIPFLDLFSVIDRLK